MTVQVSAFNGFTDYPTVVRARVVRFNKDTVRLALQAECGEVGGTYRLKDGWPVGKAWGSIDTADLARLNEALASGQALEP